MKIRILTVLFFIFSSNQLLAQLEASNWYFGEQAGVSFNSGEPQALFDGQLDSQEGCAAISTAGGDLLFYTNGETVWNRFHDIMANGDMTLAGSQNSTQAALIVPHPGNANLFFIFTNDAVQNFQNNEPRGFNYSVVNMSNGVGVVSQLNIPLLPATTEKVTAVSAANGTDIWVITHFEDTFYSFLIDQTGVNPQAVTSTVPFGVTDSSNFRGAMKASPRGSRLAIAHTILNPARTGALLLYDFNRVDGTVSNEQLIDDEFLYYGVEFSSDDAFLYASGKEIINANSSGDFFINQFDLNSNDISNSRFILTSIPEGVTQGDLGGTLQLAIDRKIYYSLPGSSLSVINEPTLQGEDADFELNETPILRLVQFGLPPFVQSFFESIFEVENVCEDDITIFTIPPENEVATAVWDFGDPASGAQNTATGLIVTHIYEEPGEYLVTVDVTFSNGRPPKTFLDVIEIFPILEIDTKITLVQCDIDGVDDGISIFNLNQALESLNNEDFDFEGTFHINFADAEDDINPIEPIGFENFVNGQIIDTIYFRAFANNDCVSIGSVTLEVQNSNDVGTINVQSCQDEEDVLDGGELVINIEEIIAEIQSDFPGDIAIFLLANDALLEIDNVEEETVTIAPSNTPQLFFRSEQQNECAAIGGILFDIAIRPEIENQNVLLCNPQEGVELSVPSQFDSFVWSLDGNVIATTPSVIVNQTGNYLIEVANATGCTGDATVTVEAVEELNVDIEVEDFRVNNRIIITTNDTNIEQLFSIDGGVTFQTSSIFENLLPDVYEVIVTDVEGCNREEFLIQVRGAPAFFTPNQDGFNDLWHVDRPEQFDNLVVRIYDRFGKLLQELGASNAGWDGNFGGRALPSSSYWYVIETDNQRFTGHFALKR